jgi:hypothetical protein
VSSDDRVDFRHIEPIRCRQCGHDIREGGIGHVVRGQAGRHRVGRADMGSDQPRLGEQCRKLVGKARIAFGRFQDERVAAGERDREHPHRHHRWEVERRDAGHHAQRLTEGDRIDRVA